MAKFNLKGIVKRVMPVVNYGSGESAGRRQSVILFVPGYVDGFGDKKGQDEEWQLDIFNDRIDKMGLNTNLHEKRVEVVVYVDSKRFQKRETGEDIWLISARLGDLTLHEPNGNTQPAQSNGSGSW
ncbi:MAG TPA: hypothetical protein VNQ80_15310 [Parapedobacter sp.]|uniref:hypothetical protein n=1 Tax=Parapedobacter sp. TaxID=1958893 RepID=UPI002B581689|nr:hypothetical protein [Parapedobacter sp.]HWK58710.1 hypothetical protein [Parapedobacter sp.]